MQSMAGHCQCLILCPGSAAEAKPKPARKSMSQEATAPPDGQPSSSETSCDDIAVTGSQSVQRVVKSRRKFKNELTTRLVAAARAALAAPETGQLLFQPAASVLAAASLTMPYHWQGPAEKLRQ